MLGLVICVDERLTDYSETKMETKRFAIGLQCNVISEQKKIN
jgi:hypothetical protein